MCPALPLAFSCIERVDESTVEKKGLSCDGLPRLDADGVAMCGFARAQAGRSGHVVGRRRRTRQRCRLAGPGLSLNLAGGLKSKPASPCRDGKRRPSCDRRMGGLAFPQPRPSAALRQGSARFRSKPGAALFDELPRRLGHPEHLSGCAGMITTAPLARGHGALGTPASLLGRQAVIAIDIRPWVSSLSASPPGRSYLGRESAGAPHQSSKRCKQG